MMAHKDRKLTDQQVREVRLRYANEGCTLAQLGAEFGMSWQAVHYVVSRRSYADVSDDTRYRPAPEDIAAACAEIRAGWSERERVLRLRADLRPAPARIPGDRSPIGIDERIEGLR